MPLLRESHHVEGHDTVGLHEGLRLTFRKQADANTAGNRLRYGFIARELGAHDHLRGIQRTRAQERLANGGARLAQHESLGGKRRGRNAASVGERVLRGRVYIEQFGRDWRDPYAVGLPRRQHHAQVILPESETSLDLRGAADIKTSLDPGMARTERSQQSRREMPARRHRGETYQLGPVAAQRGKARLETNEQLAQLLRSYSERFASRRKA